MKYPASLSIVLTFCLPVGLIARTKTDVLVMTNGDRFTCEIKKLERGVLYASFEYVDGTVSIQWSKVARVETNQLFLTHTQDGSRKLATEKTIRQACEPCTST